MRKTFLVAMVVISLSMFCVAADVPKAEVFGGYSLLHASSDFTDIPGQNAHGWDAAVTGNLNHYFGVTADLSGQYKSEDILGVTVKGHVHNFLFGPTLSYRLPKVKPFGHALLGFSRLTGTVEVPIVGGTVSVSDNAFAMALGGGVDVSVGKVFSVRLGQLDYVRTQFGGSSQNNLRFAAGVVLKF